MRRREFLRDVIALGAPAAFLGCLKVPALPPTLTENGRSKAAEVSMIDHLALKVSDFARSRHFYEAVLAPLGFGFVMEHEISGAGFGRDGRPILWIQPSSSSGPSGPLHFALSSPDRTSVRRFYEVALASGGKDNGAPGLRPEYHPNYYGAFVLDPDGINIEATCHLPESE